LLEARMHHLILFLLAAAPTPPPVAAPSPAPVRSLETVLVRGAQPGPRLWRVEGPAVAGQPPHVLWILGTLSPLPAQMAWQSAEVEAIVAQAGVVLAPPHATAKLGAGGMFKAATLLPSAMKSVKNTGGATLAEVLPPDLHARWVEAKRAHGVTDRKIDALKPTLAALELHARAVTHAGLARRDVQETVLAAAKRHRVPVEQPGVTFKLDIDRKRMKGGIKAFAGLAPDIACFRDTLDGLDAQLAQMRTRANAWARGDLDVLRRVTVGDLQSPCRKIEQEALAFMRRPDLEGEVAEGWVQASRKALEAHPVSLAVLPIERIVGDPRLLPRLKALGYVVREPDEDESEEPEPEEASPAG
jgi:uncharacterized protein YbaP (TraB family)